MSQNSSSSSSSSSLLICGLSGSVPAEPVVSKLSGVIYERRLIQAHIEATGTEPGTSNSLSLSDLLPLSLSSSAAVRVRVPSASSIPSLLSSLQSEFDGLVVENYSLKQQLDSTRQELAHALYQHDAATRVIARIVKERDEARQALASAPVAAPAPAPSPSPSSSSSSSDMNVEESNLGIAAPSVLSILTETAKALSKDRKKRVREVCEGIISREEVADLSMTSSYQLHSTSEKGITCAVRHATNNDIIITGGNDSTVIVFNKSTGKILDTLRGHQKKITSIAYAPASNTIISASKDNTVQFWNQGEDGKYGSRGSLSLSGSAVSLSVHPSSQYGVVGSSDGSWTFFDVASARSRERVPDTSPLRSINFHPDGLILGAGNDEGVLKIWDVKAVKNVATFKGHSSRLTSLSFSENGFYLASAEQTGQVKIWDLRKLSNLHTIASSSSSSNNSNSVGLSSFVSWDPSGSYLLVSSSSSSSFAVYSSKDWSTVKEHSDDNTKQLTSISAIFTKSKAEIITTSNDRTLAIYTQK